MKSHYFKNYKNRWLLTLKVHNLNSCQKQSWDCWEVSAGLSQMSQLRVPYNEFREQNQAWNIILQKVSSISQNLSSLWLFLTRIGSTFGSIDLVPWEHGLHLQSLIKVSQSSYTRASKLGIDLLVTWPPSLEALWGNFRCLPVSKLLSVPGHY